MKKIFTIAWKDIHGTVRSVFSLVMMFVTPFLITGLLYFAFGTGSDDEEASIPRLSLYVVNNDEGTPSMGSLFIDALRSEGLRDILEITGTGTFETGKEAVYEGGADLLMVIPTDFSSQFRTGTAELNLYRDPAAQVLAEIGKGMISDVLEHFSTTSVLQMTARRMFGARNIPLPKESAARLQEEFIQILSGGHDGKTPETGAATPHPMTAYIMLGMIIFILFFTAANSAQSIVVEKETGTLDRLQTSPVGSGKIVAGKMLGVFFTVLINALVLIVLSTILFKIRWNTPYLVALQTIALVISASGFGIFLMTLVRSSRQTGPVIGAVITITGMMGGLFTIGVPNLPPSFDTVTKFVPQGWGMSGFRELLQGAPPENVLPAVLVLTASGFLFYGLGFGMMKRRYRF